MTAPNTVAGGNSIAELTRTIVESKLELPPLPELALRVRTMLSDENVDTKQVALLIGTDPAITSTLLRRANSVTFGGLSEITQITHAVARLGLKQVESLVTTMALKKTFEVADPDKQECLRALWDHSLIVGIGAKLIAHRGGRDPESIFLAGLLHDIGRLVVLKGIDDLQKSRKIEVTHVVLEELMEVMHCELGHQALVAWNLPEELSRVAMHHEDTPEDADDFPLLAVQAADSISCKLGFHPTPDPDLVLLEEPAIELLNLGDIELAMLMVDLEDEFDSLRALL